MEHLFMQIGLALCVVLLILFIVIIVYAIQFMKVFHVFKKRIYQLRSLQRENRQTMENMKQKVVEIETTPLFGKRTKRVVHYKNTATSIAGFRKQQKLKKNEKQITKSKARKVQRKVCNKHGK